jgi:site-specific DNA-methyltransferase (adenine-specific)
MNDKLNFDRQLDAEIYRHCNDREKPKQTKLKQQEDDSIPVDCIVTPQPNTFINADCMDYLPKCPANYFDLAIVDPPYGLGVATKRFENGVNGRVGKNPKWKKEVWKDYSRKDWDASPPPPEYFEELRRVSKNQIIWGGNYFVLPASSGWIFWDKKNGESSYSDGELAWTSFHTALRMFSFLWNGFQKGEVTKRIHPSQKPTALYRWILKNYAKAGDLILDTHVGSGSSIVACKELGFDYVGFEIDKEYYEGASKRVARAFRKYELELK